MKPPALLKQGHMVLFSRWHGGAAAREASSHETYFSKPWSLHDLLSARLSRQRHQHKQDHQPQPPPHLDGHPHPHNHRRHQHHQDASSSPHPTLAMQHVESSLMKSISTQGRLWQYAPRKTSASQETFVVASYNILAAALAWEHKDLYLNVRNEQLDWSTRKKRILFELACCSPDVICLQEVDMFKELAEDLKSTGYVGIHKARTGTATDGCAIFWRKERFDLVQEESLEFNMYGMRDNVAQLCVLQSMMPVSGECGVASLSRLGGGLKRYVVVGNIHVLYNPKRGDIKLGQCRTFLERAHNLSTLWHGASVIIGGDFNCTPSSAVYDYLAMSELDLVNLDRRYLSGQIDKAKAHARLNGRNVDSSNGPGSSSEVNRQHKDKSLGDVPLDCSTSHPISQGERCVLYTASDCRTGHSSRPDEEKHNGNTWTGHCLAECSTIQAERREAYPSGMYLGTEEESMNEGMLLAKAVEVQQSCMTNRPPGTSDKNGHDSPLEANDVLSSQFLEARRPFRSTTDNCRAIEMPDKSREEEKDGCNNDIVDHIWDFEELRMATGQSDCAVIKHKLNLWSVYSEIQGQVGTRDSKGEPLVTSFHEKFKGTVDYLWRSNGLETVKVLDTVPVKTLHKCRGHPLKVWGSDHLAIACELAFPTSENGG